MNLNRVMLAGRIGKDPEVRYTSNSTAVANFSLATNETWKDKGGQRQERTEWHTIVAWGKLAEFCQNYLKKGTGVYVEGKLTTRDWTDTNNVRHYKTEVVASTINFTDSKAVAGNNEANAETPPKGDINPQNTPDNQYMDDDIPF